MLNELVSPLLVQARLEVQDASLRDWHHVVVTRETVWPVPISGGAQARRLAVAVRKHLVLRENLNVLEDALGAQGLGNGFNVHEDDAGHAGCETVHNLGEGHVKMKELVVVDVKEPGDASRTALGNRATHLPLLPLHESVIVVGGMRIERVERVVVAGGHRHEVGKLVGGQHGHELGRVLNVHEDVRDAQRAMITQPPVKFMWLAGHERYGHPELLLGHERRCHSGCAGCGR